MSRHAAVNETIDVTIRVLPSGKIAPKSFRWQGRTYYVVALGRQWDELTDGRRIRCFLVQTQGQSSFELRWDAAKDEWVLYQAWHADFV